VVRVIRTFTSLIGSDEKMATIRKLSQSCLFLVCILLFVQNFWAQEKVNQAALSFGFWIGYTNMSLNTDYYNYGTQGGIAMGMNMGYAPNTKITVGFEANYYSLKEYDYEDLSKGLSVSNISIYLNYFPFSNFPLSVMGGGGLLYFDDNNVGIDESGRSWFLGSTYEIPVGGAFIVPQVRYYQGDFKFGDTQGFEISIGLLAYIGRTHNTIRKVTPDQL
jgi:hypothetical protein